MKQIDKALPTGMTALRLNALSRKLTALCVVAVAPLLLGVLNVAVVGQGLNSAQASAQTDGPWVVGRGGVVYARNLVRGPAGEPIFAEYGSDGSVVREIGEASGELAGPVRVIIGMGCNVWMRAGPELDQPWTSLVQLGWQGSRTGLANRLMARLNEDLPRFAEQGFAPFLAGYQQRDVLQDQPVTVDEGGRLTAGVARGVDLSGRLQCEINGQLVALASGDVSVRRQ